MKIRFMIRFCEQSKSIEMLYYYTIMKETFLSTQKSNKMIERLIISASTEFSYYPIKGCNIYSEFILCVLLFIKTH